jgi:UDP-N-acetylglucosamine 2-epimerase (non-hydrolysing)
MSQRQANGRIAIVLGTRPEIIKMSKIAEILGDEATVVHTGQHFDANLSAEFFTEFGMREPEVTIGVGGSTRGRQIGDAIASLDEWIATSAPTAIVVQGDTNAALAGGIAANANDVPLVHVEAGLRSFDRAMPEEHNRVLVDHLADLCLAPTPLNAANLAAESIPAERVVITGNPIVEAVERLLPTGSDRAKIIDQYGVEPSRYITATIHRPENTDDAATLTTVMEALGSLDAPVILPLHPRTRAKLGEFGIDISDRITVIEPIGYRQFLALASQSRLVVSDSGGIQEEVSVYKRPAVVIRRSTERQEVEGTFVERIEPTENLASALANALNRSDTWTSSLEHLPSPYGDGESPNAIANQIQKAAGS